MPGGAYRYDRKTAEATISVLAPQLNCRADVSRPGVGKIVTVSTCCASLEEETNGRDMELDE
jgi:hypothetical protein